MRSGNDSEIAQLRDRLTELEDERASLLLRLGTLELPSGVASAQVGAIGRVNASSSNAEKVALFRTLFGARSDVYAMRWENAKSGRSGYAPACSNEWVAGICNKPQIKCSECLHQAFLPLSADVVERHLRGKSGNRADDFVAGAYPVSPDDTCWLLAADFDGDAWAADALAYLQACRAKNVPAALERSRSGNGGHVWIFFAEPVLARDARKLGSLLLTAAMECRPEIAFSSYDRLFPSQDVLPIGGFGNLIALPLQGRARARGNSVFGDDELRPYDDQWTFLSSLTRLSAEAVSDLVHAAETSGSLLGVRMPVEDESADQPWLLPPSRHLQSSATFGRLPPAVRVVLADEVYVDRSGLPAPMITLLVRIAAFQNPEYYRAQQMRLPTFGKPRVISCAALHTNHVALPRGCLDEALELLRSHGIEAMVEDRRQSGAPIAASFLGTLRSDQVGALEAISQHDFGVLAATTAFGKTVVAAALIARRARNTLILVHRKELLTQWVERLRTFLSTSKDDIGTIAGGRRKPTGRIDVALIQSLVRKGEVSDIVGDYGHLIVDECHHLSASSFELVARRSKARYVLGLSATVTRKDGHHPIILMQCGPIRHKISAKSEAARQSFDHVVHLRPTGFQPPAEMTRGGRLSMPSVYSALANDEARNTLIIDDVIAALEAGRCPIVLTERRDHLEYLHQCCKGATPHLIMLRGGMGAKERRAVDAALRASRREERLVLATGRYLGEGFDDPRLDTLFLTMPISWRGPLAQYVGRLHRDYQGKNEVIVYDYVDADIPVLVRMASKRQAGYRALGYAVKPLSAHDGQLRATVSAKG